MSKKPPAPPALSRVRGGVINLSRPDTDHARAVGGSNRDVWNSMLLNQTLYTYWVPAAGLTPDEHNNMAEAAAIALESFKPRDPVEAMMAAQAVAQHFASMECSRRGMIPEQPFEVAQAYRKASANASRTFIELAGALDRKRGKHRKQVVRVEKVTIQPGAQAVLGIANAGGRCGSETGIEGEAHATEQLAGPPGASVGVSPVRCSNPERQPVPIAGDAKPPVPHARR